jgi:hypothetical protein
MSDRAVLMTLMSSISITVARQATATVIVLLDRSGPFMWLPPL